jgi:SRSO17 transposase
MSPEKEAEESEKRFAAYVDQLASVMGHADRERRLWD